MNKRAQETKKALTEEFGEGLISDLSGKQARRPVGWDLKIPRLNMIMSGDPFVGIMPSRHYEFFGGNHTGKTTDCLHAVAAVQEQGGVVGWIDAEQAFHPGYAKDLGVRLEDLIFDQPEFGEQAIEVLRGMILQKVDMIVVDSVAMLVPRSEIEGTMEKNQPGTQARLMDSALRRVTADMRKHKSAVLWINQIRNKIGVLFGSPETTKGGLALPFYASVRLRISASQAKGSMDKSEVTSLVSADERQKKSTIQIVECIKNKLARPFEKGEFTMNFGTGLDAVLDHYEFALNIGICRAVNSAMQLKGTARTFTKDELLVVKGGYALKATGEKFKKNDFKSVKAGYIIVASNTYVANADLEAHLPTVRQAIKEWNDARYKEGANKLAPVRQDAPKKDKRKRSMNEG